MKRIIIILVAFGILQGVNAQQYPLFSNYITNAYGYNPALVGIQECWEAKGTYRHQWAGFEGNPITQILAINGKLRNKPFGLGVMVYKDVAGKIKNTGGNLTLTYIKSLSSSAKLSIGVRGGLYKFNILDGYVAPNEGSLMNLKNEVTPSFSGGIYFRGRKLFLGVSIPQIVNFELDFVDTQNDLAKLFQHYYGLVGYDVYSSEKMVLTPMALLKFYKTAPLQVEAGLKATFSKKYWISANYRLKDAITVAAGMSIKKLSFSYGYDLTVSDIRLGTTGGHELGLAYKFCRGADRDKDGVLDKNDICPDVPGTKELKGCPDDSNGASDRDKDGILDKDDKCPDVAGIVAADGCPGVDTDGDGVLDKDDKCPNVAGVKDAGGCPSLNKDKDGDGILDENDDCPDVYGISRFQGCPFLDSDGDGVKDEDDSCPNLAGDPGNSGCPKTDSDGDGVPDDIDKCPTTYGTLADGGCPTSEIVGAPNYNDNRGQNNDQDRDQDGVLDQFDNCPDVWGVIENNGCPVVVENDSDKDGVPDYKDNCPDVWGAIENFGCPVVVDNDTDKDGIADEDDDCPNTWGLRRANGCPVVTDYQKSVIDLAINNVYFETNKWDLKYESKRYLNELANILRTNPGYRLKIIGFADPRGSAEHNLMLSKNRAYAVRDYFVSLGLSSQRFEVEYYGEEGSPYETNDSALQKHRRTQLQYIFN